MHAKLIAAASLFCLSLASFQTANAGDDSTAVTIFPGKKLFPRFTADGLAHQLSLSRVTENRDWIGAVGGSIPMVQLDLENVKMQGSIAVTIFNRLEKTPGHISVLTMDYKVDLPIDFRFSELALRVAAGHISSHFADDAIEMFGKKSIQHANDYVTLAAAYDVRAIQGHVYGGVNYSYGTQPIQYKPWLFQFGAEFANIRLHDEVTAYGAFDIKIRQEVGWGSTRSFQAGFKLFPRRNFGLRVAYTLRMGFEERGQYYLNKETMNLISLFIDF